MEICTTHSSRAISVDLIGGSETPLKAVKPLIDDLWIEASRSNPPDYKQSFGYRLDSLEWIND